jgi:hypothetical protein
VLQAFLLDFSDKEEPVTDNEEFYKVDQHCENYQLEKGPSYQVSIVIFSHEVS